MAGGAQQQQPQGDNSLAPLWITVLVFCALGLLWYFGHGYIVAAVFQIKLLQADLMSIIFSKQLAEPIAYIQNANPGNVTFTEMAEVSTAIGNFFRYPVIAILLVLAILLYLNNTTLRYRKTYSMQSLRDAEKEEWPQIKPILNVDLVEEDIDKGPWAMALSPMQFAKRYNLLQQEPTPLTETMLRHKAKPTVSLKKGRASNLFIMQLGRYWEGIDALNPHSRALFATFAARINRDSKRSIQLLEQIANSVPSGKIDYTGTNALIRKYGDSKDVRKVIEGHAFVSTVMASMLEEARKDGIFASADFLWLKPKDRQLWFLLNSIGRQTPFPEVAGAFAHWISEKEAGRKIMVPMIEEAIVGLDIAIKEQIYNPDEF